MLTLPWWVLAGFCPCVRREESGWSEGPIRTAGFRSGCSQRRPGPATVLCGTCSSESSESQFPSFYGYGEFSTLWSDRGWAFAYAVILACGDERCHLGERAWLDLVVSSDSGIRSQRQPGISGCRLVLRQGSEAFPRLRWESFRQVSSSRAFPQCSGHSYCYYFQILLTVFDSRNSAVWTSRDLV